MEQSTSSVTIGSDQESLAPFLANPRSATTLHSLLLPSIASRRVRPPPPRTDTIPESTHGTQSPSWSARFTGRNQFTHPVKVSHNHDAHGHDDQLNPSRVCLINSSVSRHTARRPPRMCPSHPDTCDDAAPTMRIHVENSRDPPLECNSRSRDRSMGH